MWTSEDVATLPPSTIASLPITSQTSAADVPHSSSPSPRSTELPTTESSVSSQDSASSQSRTGLATSSVSAVQTPSSTPLIASTSLQSPSPSVTSDFSGVASSVATTPVATISSTPQSSASSATAIPSVSSAISLSSSSGATRGSLSSSVLTTSTGPISSSSMSASSIIPTSSSEAAQTSVPLTPPLLPSGGPSSSAGSSTSVAPAPTVGPAEKQIYLDQHNAVRRRFNAPPLIWSDDLQSKAQSYAERCELRHSDGANGPVGENLAAATGVFDTTSAVNLFVRDMANFDPAQFVFSHFTQVVWKSTTQLGCGVALCDNIFPARKGKATYHVCLYDPVGNVIGEEK
ncbi:CAP domain-containing protein [Trametes punicea]|nr:CAP domain-containing protein [Trametes punicea]